MISQLFGYRWKFYIRTTADAVQRHKHIVLLLSILIGPMVFAILLALAKPVLNLLNPISVVETLKLWAIFLLLHVLWSSFQRKALSGGKQYQYLMLNPISNSTKFRVEIQFLAILSIVIQVPFIIALIYSWSEQDLGSILSNCILILLRTGSFLLIQMLIVQNNRYKWPICIISFVLPLSLTLFKFKILTIVFSVLFIVITYQYWFRAKTSKAFIIKRPNFLSIQAQYSVSTNLLILNQRKLFNRFVLTQRIIFIVIAWSASFVLAWFAFQKDSWTLVNVDVSPLKLMNLMCATYITLILTQIGIMKASLVNMYGATNRFWLNLGVSQKQWVFSEVIALSSVALFASLSTLFWIVFTYGLTKAVIICLFILLVIPIIRMIYTKPEDVHGIVPTVLFIAWFILSATLLNI